VSQSNAFAKALVSKEALVHWDCLRGEVPRLKKAQQELSDCADCRNFHIRALAKAGYSERAISKEAGISNEAVHQIIRKSVSGVEGK